jgi:hypothetical protein
VTLQHLGDAAGVGNVRSDPKNHDLASIMTQYPS